MRLVAKQYKVDELRFLPQGMKGAHKILLREREWLSVLLAINATGKTIPNYYIFKGVKNERLHHVL